MLSSTLNYRFSHVKNQVDGFGYITTFMKLKKVGVIYTGSCPFHNEKTPSFRVYPPGYIDKGVRQDHVSFYCFGCSAGGDVFEFRKRIENLSNKVKALELFEQELGIKIEEDDIQVEYLRDTLEKIKNTPDQMLSISEVNMVCSTMCRNYLLWVKDNFEVDHQDEIQVIEKFYTYFDFVFEEKSAMDCMNLVNEVQMKIEKRRKNLFEKQKVLLHDG